LIEIDIILIMTFVNLICMLFFWKELTSQLSLQMF